MVKISYSFMLIRLVFRKWDNKDVISWIVGKIIRLNWWAGERGDVRETRRINNIELN